MPDQHQLFDELPEIDPALVEQPFLTMLIHFASPDDRRAFEKAIGRAIPPNEVIWYPRDPVARWGE